MTSSKNPVREFIEILRRIRTGHENLKVSSGIPGFIPGTGERVDAFSTALPWESATPLYSHFIYIQNHSCIDHHHEQLLPSPDTTTGTSPSFSNLTRQDESPQAAPAHNGRRTARHSSDGYTVVLSPQCPNRSRCRLVISTSLLLPST